MAGEVPKVTLNSGFFMPVIGMGTASGTLSADISLVFLDAIKAGYRHFDTASIYKSEKPLGRAIAAAIEEGLIHSRDDLFITSKLWCTDAHPDLVLPALKLSLQNLGLEYLDLYLIHWPVRLLKSGEFMDYPFPKENLAPFEISSTWAAMEECHKLGLVKSIGVSNFSCIKLSELLAHATIPPAVNQLREFCRDKGIHVSAWSPLAASGAPWGSNAVMENPVLKEIAIAEEKTVANVALRWLYEQGVSIIVKSFNKERMKENMKIFDWELTEEEAEKIDKVPQKKGMTGEGFVHPNGPFKTVEELWDGEI
ncbi:hypothetical protein J5N97_009486 [Dioscorea zingiberensis]|uniref:NADP-dependent oxidoreductase domain-containing protein n=1 Tax=Dioscorea zingiberensis TaxID=325984 RepID=A0A9D5CWZ4_9LILI|nr:hypothetical protein J5N97_009486 [Dioscorea zingiberensis]